LAQAELEADELNEFIRFVSKMVGVGIRPLSARIKKERAERVRKAPKKSGDESDDRIVRSRPEPDGELLPIVSFLDELLSNDQSEEPPMRSAAGALVRVEERDP